MFAPSSFELVEGCEHIIFAYMFSQKYNNLRNNLGLIRERVPHE